MSACNDRGAAVVGAEIGQVGEGFDKGKMVEPFFVVVIGRVDAAVKSIALIFCWQRAANMGIGLHHSSTGRTNLQGAAQLDVLEGTFQIFVTHPQYHSSATPKIEVRSAHRADDILLVPISSP